MAGYSSSGGYGSYGGMNGHGYSYSALSSSLDSEHSDRRSCTACNATNQARRDSVSSASRIRIDGLASPPPKLRSNDLSGYASLPSGLTLPRSAMQKPSTHANESKPQQPAPCHLKGHHTSVPVRPKIYQESHRRKGYAQRSSGESRPMVRHSINSARSRRSNQAPGTMVREPKPTYASSKKSKKGRGLWGCFGG